MKTDPAKLSLNTATVKAQWNLAKVIEGCARHVAEHGALVTGFQPGRGYDLATFDADCAAAGLGPARRYATWDGDPFREGEYAVSIHRRGARLE